MEEKTQLIKTINSMKEFTNLFGVMAESTELTPFQKRAIEMFHNKGNINVVRVLNDKDFVIEQQEFDFGNSRD